jgi:hypothetical protein
MSNESTIACTSSGYHMFNRRQVALTIVSGVLQLHESGRSVTITRAEALPIMWIGKPGSAPSVPLAGLVLDGPGGAWVVVTSDTTVVPADAVEHSESPHVSVSGEDLARMAAACGIGVSSREPWMPPPVDQQKLVVTIIGICGVIGLFVTIALVFGPQERRSTQSCSKQRAPVEELYPRLSCRDARAELDRVVRGEATPRAIVLRASSVIVDARDTTGPAKITCDGIEFAVVDAIQAAPEPFSLGDEGLHSVLVEEQTDGTLRPSQYCACCNVMGRERPGPMP